MITTAVIPAAGKGTRMLHLVQDKPKHLIEVVGKPFLYYLLTNLKAAGITTFVLVVGYHKEAMEVFAADHADEFKIILVDQAAVVGDRYGTACAIEAVESVVPNEPFLAIYGDNMFEVSDIRRILVDDGYNAMAVMHRPDAHKYGVVELNGDLVTNLIEKPANPPTTLVNTGMYKFLPSIFPAIRKIGLSPRGEYELTDAIKLLAKQHMVKAMTLEGRWLDFGNPSDIPVVENYLRDQS